MKERCMICGNKYAECTHHLIGGSARRKLSDKDGLYIRLCNECHNMAIKPQDRIHGNSKAEILSKMLGQAIYERNYIAEMISREETEEALNKARGAFIGRYGRSYL